MDACAIFCLTVAWFLSGPLRAQAPPVSASVQAAPSQSAAQPSPDPAYPLMDRGYQALKTHDLESAVGAFEQAAQIAPERPSIHKELAFTYVKMGETEKAIREFEKIRQLAPGDYDNALSLAFLYFETQREAQALGLFEFAAKSPIPRPEIRRGRAWPGFAAIMPRASGAGSAPWSRTRKMSRRGSNWARCIARMATTGRPSHSTWRCAASRRTIARCCWNSPASTSWPTSRRRLAPGTCWPGGAATPAFRNSAVPGSTTPILYPLISSARSSTIPKT